MHSVLFRNSLFSDWSTTLLNKVRRRRKVWALLVSRCFILTRSAFHLETKKSGSAVRQTGQEVKVFWITLGWDTCCSKRDGKVHAVFLPLCCLWQTIIVRVKYVHLKIDWKQKISIYRRMFQLHIPQPFFKIRPTFDFLMLEQKIWCYENTILEFSFLAHLVFSTVGYRGFQSASHSGLRADKQKGSQSVILSFCHLVSLVSL